MEELGVKSGLPTAALLGVLMKLELAGRVELPAGQTVYSARRKRKLKRNNLSVIAARCHLPTEGGLAYRKASPLRQRLPYLGEAVCEAD